MKITPRRELLNARVYFIPAGTVVADTPSVTVTSTTWPDNAPTTNYTDWMLHDTETIEKKRAYATETFKIPKATGGYVQDKENTLESVIFTGESHKTREIFKQLEWGLATAPEVGTAQSPFVRQDDYIEGVCLMEFQAKSGSITERVQFWGRLRVEDEGKVGPDTRKLTYSVELRDSGNNTYVGVA